MKKLSFIFIILYFVGLQTASAQVSIESLHGDERYSMNGLHSGNMIRTTFYNDGQVGHRSSSPTDIQGEWPINSGTAYLAKMAIFIGAEVKDSNGEVKHIVSEANGTRTGGLDSSPSSGDWGPNGEWYSFTPLPGFANPDPGAASPDDKPHVAMSHWDWSWPQYWPDKMEDATDPGWNGSWNGYFGKDIKNADQESYYVIDDYNNREFSFYPDENDLSRRGLGLRTTVRGFQWSNVLVEDVLFLLYDVQNIGTYEHDKMNFSMMYGPNIGETSTNTDGDDDGGKYDLDEELGYQYDEDDIGGGGWSPVGYLGSAFFETPGNPYDGIDNDGDEVGSANIITLAMFEPRTVNVNDNIVLIDYKTFKRTLTTMPAEGVTFTYLEKEYKILPGELEEVANNLIDDNLNGLIDENNGSVFGEGETALERFLYEGLAYTNYLAGETSAGALIDERRDDGIDNDDDWDPEKHDVGLDGVPNTGDFGEGDGLPTSGAGTNLPGEPNIDKTDIDESDMIGLTAFNIFSPWTIYPLYEDEVLWEATTPGFLNENGQVGNTDILLASGYFPLQPIQIERYSVGVIFGIHDELFRNKKYAEKTYLENYNFAKAPDIPKVTAIPGDNKVTLLWDDTAEKSEDPISGKDFEGYRIYRSTDPGFNEMTAITDGYGSLSYRKPLAQFDLADGITGFSNIAVNGSQYYLGDDTGLVHSFVDTTAVNGFTYYYAITAYDFGDDSLGISPSECSRYISISPDGKVDKGNNVAIVRPEAPAAGYVPAGFDSSGVLKAAGSTTDASISYKIIATTELKNENEYKVVFADTAADRMGHLRTKNYSIINTTSGDTLVNQATDLENVPIVEGFQLAFANNPEMLDADLEASSWNSPNIYDFVVKPFYYRNQAVELHPADFQIIIGDVGIDTSTTYLRGTTELPSIPVNFTVVSTNTNKKIKFAFREQDVLEGEDGKFTGFTAQNRTDQIILLSDSLKASWEISLVRTGAAEDTLQPGPGSILSVKLNQPFLSNDEFRFKVNTAKLDRNLAKEQLEDIKVVPNPYVVANSWEPLNPYSNGRGPRELHFIHLPAKCTIKIFTASGQLVQTLEHDNPEIADGTEIWDMQTKDFLDIAYGIYVYHVDAGELGQKIGKFAVIK